MRGVVLLVIAACGRIGFDPLGGGDAGVSGRIAQLSLGQQHSCIRTIDGDIWCWGLNSNGQLGLGGALVGSYVTTPHQVAPGQHFIDLATGWRHTCAVDDQGRAWCWGDNENGELGITDEGCGDGIVGGTEQCDDANEQNGDACNVVCQIGATAPDVPDPAQLPNIRTYKRIFAGDYHTCAIASDDTLWCWGRNGAQELGLGDNFDHSRPHQIHIIAPQTGADDDWLLAGLGSDHTCAIKIDLHMWCWGSNGDGQLVQSTNPMIDRGRPEVILPSDSTWRAVEAGQDFECMLGDDSVAYCAGLDDRDQLGADSTASSNNATSIHGPVTSGWTQIAAGLAHACAIRDDHSLWCWGENPDGEVGIGVAGVPVPAPARVTGEWQLVSAGNGHTCAVDLAGGVWCWGLDNNGELGTGDPRTNSTVPVAIGGVF